jgi:hypothetical protein
MPAAANPSMDRTTMGDQQEKTASQKKEWLGVVALLILLSCPWYWTVFGGAEDQWALPGWLLWSLGIALAIALITAWASLHRWHAGDNDD